MTIFDYTAYAKDKSHDTQFGEVEADTFEEAEAKIKTRYNYPVKTELSMLLNSGPETFSEEQCDGCDLLDALGIVDASDGVISMGG